MNELISLKGITKSYDQLVALDNLTLSIASGQMFTLVGPDGAGKTTLLKILCGILFADSGSITLDGLTYPRELKKIKEKIGYLSQNFTLYGDLSVDENLEFFAEIHQVKDYKQRREELLDFTRLKPFRKRAAARLSGGMKQKLALSCTLIHNPEVIFLDEPTTGVDPVSRRDFWIILQNLLQSGITIVMTTPYLDEAERSHTIGLLNLGRLLFTGPPDQLKQSLNKKIFELITSDIRKTASILATLPDSNASFEDVQLFGDRLNIMGESREALSRVLEPTLKQEQIQLLSLRQIPPSLENAFIHLLKEKGSRP